MVGESGHSLWKVASLHLTNESIKMNFSLTAKICLKSKPLIHKTKTAYFKYCTQGIRAQKVHVKVRPTRCGHDKVVPEAQRSRGA